MTKQVFSSKFAFLLNDSEHFQTMVKSENKDDPRTGDNAEPLSFEWSNYAI
jgi:hypothetical protein